MTISFSEIAPYLHKSLHLNLERFEAIKRFLQNQLGFATLTAKARIDYSSCNSFRLTFNKEWSLLEPNTPMGEAHFSVHVHVSERGPFVTSRGDELQPYKETDWRPAGDSTGMFRPSDVAEAKAKEIAQQIAEQFNLTYLDREWLAQQRLDEKTLPADALSEIDDNEPTALNVLFTCYP
jgi:hypothetical protein